MTITREVETNLARAVVKFVSEVGDIYERAQLMHSMVGVGDAAATPGFMEHLVAHVNASMGEGRSGSRDGARGKPLCEAVDTPFAADCILWTGAAIIGDRMQQQLGRQDRGRLSLSSSSDIRLLHDEDRISMD